MSNKQQKREKIVISKSAAGNFDTSHLDSFANFPGNHEFVLFTDQKDTHPYKFYAYLSTLFNNTTILDIGTRQANSALALSNNPNNKIISYDVVVWASFSEFKKDNVTLKIQDFMQDKSINYDDVDIILIDVDPHDGIQEVEMLKFLKEKGWSGILLFDDIDPVLWAPVNEIWNNLEHEKFDLTDIGHFSGTGLINFGGRYEIEIVD